MAQLVELVVVVESEPVELTLPDCSLVEQAELVQLVALRVSLLVGMERAGKHVSAELMVQAGRYLPLGPVAFVWINFIGVAG